MPGPPVVSLVTPAYNQARFLPETIESVLAQDYPSLEYIVIDDGSTDETPAVLERYRGRVRCERHPNMGQASTLNRGWQLASGSVLGYLSADDLLYPGAVGKVVEALTARADTVMAYPDYSLIDPYSRVIRRSTAAAPDYRALAVEHRCMIGPGALFLRSAYERAGGWNPGLRFLPDYEFWLRLGLVGGFTLAPEPLAGFRMHPASTSYFRTDPQAAAEHVTVTSGIFDRGDLPGGLRRERGRALAQAHLAAARLHLRGGRPGACLRHVREARALDDTLALLPTTLMLLRTATSRSVHRAAWSARHLARRLRRPSSSRAGRGPRSADTVRT